MIEEKYKNLLLMYNANLGFFSSNFKFHEIELKVEDVINFSQHTGLVLMSDGIWFCTEHQYIWSKYYIF